MTDTRITSLSINCYSYQTQPSGVFHVHFEGGNMCLDVTPEAAEEIWRILIRDFKKHQQKIAQNIAAISAPVEPLALTGPIVDNEESLF